MQKTEYIVSMNTGCEVVWQHKLYLELRFVQKLGTCFLTDNNLALQMIDTPDQVTNHTKHIHYNYHWTKEEACKCMILLEHVPSKLNTVDIFTKGFHAPLHDELCRMLDIGPWNDAH